MSRIRLATIIFLIIALVPFAQVKQKPVVDYKADSFKFKDQGSYIELIGNVVFYHNGVFITCDTAYRYSEQHMEGVGNVIINSDSTFIYGDKFVYNGETNIARVFSPLIKTIDKDAILYTRNMEFNTLENTGVYFGGGTTTQGQNLMESDRGIYYVGTREILLTGDVEMKNDNYKIISDSVRYNFNNEVVTFLTHTDIWNEEGEFLKAKQGKYNTRSQIYDFYEDAYVLTSEQELWADSMVYKSEDKSAELKRNIQMFDSTKRVFMLGDDGRYWGQTKRMQVTDNPVVISYDEQKLDSAFLRADTMLMVPMLDPLLKPTIIEEGVIDTLDAKESFEREVVVVDSINTQDVIKIDSVIVDTMEIDERVERIKRKREERELKQKQKQEEREKKRAEKRLKKADRVRKLLKMQDDHDHDHDHEHDHEHEVDSVKVDSIISVMPKDKEIAVPLVADSSDYFIYAINNVKSYKSDMQMISDSMVINSLDSTTTLYNKPIVWSSTNQITADSLKLFTVNQQPEKAELYNFPILAQNISRDKYNQIKGKYMEAYFVNNEIDVLYVDGNSESIYYRVENTRPTALINVTSANMVMYFDSTEISDIKWYKNYEFEVIPIEKITPETSEILDDFEWHGELRPSSPLEITTRQVRESIRKEMEKVKEPQFIISDAIENEKIKLIEEGTWRDRNEELPVNKDEFINRVFN